MVFVAYKVPLITGTSVLSMDYLPQLGHLKRQIYLTHSQGME